MKLVTTFWKSMLMAAWKKVKMDTPCTRKSSSLPCHTMIWERELCTFEASLPFFSLWVRLKVLKMCDTFPIHSLSVHLLPQTSVSQDQKPSLPSSLKPKANEVTVKDELNYPGLFSPPLCIPSNSETASPNKCSVTRINCNGFLIFLKKRIPYLQVIYYC